MAFCELHLYSQALGLQTTVYAIIPQKKASGEIGIEKAETEGKFKCLYLLHGLSDDHTIWMRRTSIERYAEAAGIAVIMPFGDRSFYSDMVHGGRYYTYIAKELPLLMRSFFNISDKREDNFIAGLSMGGYGALKIGLKNPENYAAVASLSGVADIIKRKETFASALKAVYGENIDIPETDDLFYLAKETDKCDVKPKIFMGVGTEDGLYPENVELKKCFEGLSYDFTYKESYGGHSWLFWDEYIKYVLEWIKK